MYFANLRRSCLVPELRKLTVALQLSPVPSILITSPMPKRECSMMSPGIKGDDEGLDSGEDEGLDSETVENCGLGEGTLWYCGWGEGALWYCGLGEGALLKDGLGERGLWKEGDWRSPSIWMKRESMSRMKREGVSNSIRPYLNLFWAQVRKQCFSALVMAT